MQSTYDIAIHEAGHAIMSVLVKRGLKYATIKNSKEYPAHCLNTAIKEGRTEVERTKILEQECLIYYAGMVAEKIMLGYENYWDGMLLTYSFSDQMKAQALTEDFYGVEYEDDVSDNVDEVNPVNKYIGEIWDKADAMFGDPLVQQQIEAVADALMMKQRISGRTVRQIMKSVADQQAA
jgi:ATP-dependent Zn protease